jgi:NAD(P)-dependent dehydrogenase (short-subunit alcohol dehydrogenase family)
MIELSASTSTNERQMVRTVVVTGSGSGIGAAVRDHLENTGCRVVGADLHGAEIEADLATTEGRAALVDGVRELSPSGIDGIVANAGVLTTDSLAIRVNHFGAVATLNGLRPLLRQPSPRAALVASRALLLPVNEAIVEACLSGDEDLAVRLADDLTDGEILYATSKRAVARWLRRVAASGAWAGAGIPLNAVAPGSVSTPMIAHRTAEEQERKLRDRPMPLGGVANAREVATAICWFLEPANTKVAGQVLFVDGGGELLMRGDDIWDSVR